MFSSVMLSSKSFDFLSSDTMLMLDILSPLIYCRPPVPQCMIWEKQQIRRKLKVIPCKSMQTHYKNSLFFIPPFSPKQTELPGFFGVLHGAQLGLPSDVGFGDVLLVHHEARSALQLLPRGGSFFVGFESRKVGGKKWVC